MYRYLQKPFYWLNLEFSPSRDGVIRRFFRLASINILSNLTVPLAGLMSVAFLGHLSELRYLEGVTLSTILFNYLYRTLGFLRMSTTGVTAQAVGRGDDQAAWLAALRNAVLALGLGGAILLLQHPLKVLGFALLSAAPDVRAAAQAYYDARIWAAPATLFNFVLIGWFLGRERSGKVLLMSVVGNGTNLLLDYLMVTCWGWGSGGAGWATAAGQSLMCLVGIVLALREVPWQEIGKVGDRLFQPSALKEALALNRDLFIRTLTFLSTFSLFTNLSSALGPEVLAENALLLQAVTLAVYVIDGLAFATESLVGVFKGQGARDELLLLWRTARTTSLAIGLAVASLFVLFPTSLFGLLTNHSELMGSLNQSVFWLVPVLGFGSVAFLLDGYFLGLAEGATLRNAALIATLLVFAPLAFLAWQHLSSQLLWLGMSSFMAARAILLGLQVPRTLKEVRPDLTPP